MGWGAGGATPHMNGVGMIVVSLRGVNFGFWSHLRSFQQLVTDLDRYLVLRKSSCYFPRKILIITVYVG